MLEPPGTGSLAPSVKRGSGVKESLCPQEINRRDVKIKDF